jgi:hypothetical protein
VDEDGLIWRLAERPYASENCNRYLLISALINGGYIDGYKKLSASCHDANEFEDCEGNSLANKAFRIENRLETGDWLSYQDSFKWYDENKHIAYNYPACGYTDVLDTTCHYFRDNVNHIYRDDENPDCYCSFLNEYYTEDDAVWSSYHDTYLPAGDSRTYWSSRYEDYLWTDADDVVETSDGEYIEGDDAVEVEDLWYHCDDDDIYYCEHCGEYFLCENMEYSPIYNEDIPVDPDYTVVAETSAGARIRIYLEDAEYSEYEKCWIYREDDEFVEDPELGPRYRSLIDEYERMAC